MFVSKRSSHSFAFCLLVSDIDTVVDMVDMADTVDMVDTAGDMVVDTVEWKWPA